MFSWSGNNSSSTTTTRNQYPGRRASRSNNTHEVAMPVEGSIRPPNGESYSRAQHLQSYVEDPTLKRSTRRVSTDDTTYDTVFQTTKGQTLILRVNIPLGSSFASSCPAMSLAGVEAQHPWVDSTMRVTGFAPIQSESVWKSSRILLGKAVHDVVNHFQLNPPEIIDITDAGLRAIQPKQSQQYARNGNRRRGSTTPPRRPASQDAPPSYQTLSNTPPRHRSAPNLPKPPEVDLPTIPKTYPEVDSKTREELDKMLEDELDFLTFVHKLDTFDKLQSITAKQVDETAELAEQNLEKESKLKEVHKQVVDLQGELKTKLDNFTKLESEQNVICAPPDVSVTLKALRQAKKEAYDSSEAFAEDWVEDGAPNVDDFVKSFVEKRKVHHMRAAKMEVLQRSGGSTAGFEV